MKGKTRLVIYGITVIVFIPLIIFGLYRIWLQSLQGNWQRRILGTTITGQKQIANLNNFGFTGGFSFGAWELTDQNSIAIRQSFLQDHQFPLAYNPNQGFHFVSWKQGPLSNFEQKIISLALEIGGPYMGVVDETGPEIFERIRKSLKNPNSYYAYDWQVIGKNTEPGAVDLYLLDFDDHLFVVITNYH